MSLTLLLFSCTAAHALVTFLACPRKVTQRRAPGENFLPAYSVVLGAFRKLALRASNIRNALPSDSVACLKFSHGIAIWRSPCTPCASPAPSVHECLARVQGARDAF